MPETSGPRITGTDAERQMDDVLWRDILGDEAGVVQDIDGSSYKLTLPSDSTTVQVGSTTQASLAIVGGFRHRIPAGETQGVTVPAVSGSARTDLIVARLDLATFTGAPGPVRLVAIQGTSTSLPAYDDSAPGVEDLPLWSLTRQPGQSLAQAVVKRLYPRISPVRSIAPDAPLPTSAPLDTVVRKGDETYVRELDAVGVPAWVSATPPNPNAMLHGSGDQAIGDNTPSRVLLSVVARNTDMATSTGRITATKSGIYLVSGMVSISGTTGRRISSIYKNGVSIPQTNHTSTPMSSPAWRVPTAAYPVDLRAGEYVELYAYQQSGATLHIQRGECFLQAHRIGNL